jgi:uncharacterized damage-inducible protein DinB
MRSCDDSIMVEVRELLEYNDKVRHRYFEALSKLPWNEFVKDKGASWSSMRNIFVHTLEATDYWLDFLRQEKARVQKKYDEYRAFEDVKAYMEHVEARMHGYLDSLPTDGLEREFMVTNDVNETVEITAEDVLIHVFEEEIHHRGELIALLWQIDVAPPSMGWKEL